MCLDFILEQKHLCTLLTMNRDTCQYFFRLGFKASSPSDEQNGHHRDTELATLGRVIREVWAVTTGPGPDPRRQLTGPYIKYRTLRIRSNSIEELSTMFWVGFQTPRFLLMLLRFCYVGAYFLMGSLGRSIHFVIEGGSLCLTTVGLELSGRLALVQVPVSFSDTRASLCLQHWMHT